MRRSEYPPYCWRFSATREPLSVAERFHSDVASGVWRANRRLKKRTILLLRLVAWPVVSTAQAIALTRRHARRLSASVGKSGSRALLEQLALAWAHAVPPRVYWRFGFWDERRREQVDRYVQRHETKCGGAYGILRRARANRGLSDKRRFWERCRACALPTPVHVLQARRSQIEWLERTTLPDADLFIKPSRGRGGAGAVLFIAVGGGRFRRHGRTRTIGGEDLLARLSRWSRRRRVLVQERLVNHADISGLSPVALSTARILTIRDERGEPTPVAGAFRMAVGVKVVDNFHAGGIAAPIDLRTGTLGSATALEPFSPRHAIHPATGERIAGRAIPQWDRALDLVRRAHAAFPGVVIVGWDVAITPSGPVLVEGNAAPDVDIHQIADDRPLGDSRFCDLLLFHLMRARADRVHRDGARADRIGRSARCAASSGH